MNCIDCKINDNCPGFDGCPHLYTTRPGESVMGIALRQLKNEKRWPEIIKLNEDRFADVGPHDYYPVGTVLVLPEKS